MFWYWSFSAEFMITHCRHFWHLIFLFVKFIFIFPTHFLISILHVIYTIAFFSVQFPLLFHILIFLLSSYFVLFYFVLLSHFFSFILLFPLFSFSSSSHSLSLSFDLFKLSNWSVNYSCYITASQILETLLSLL